MFCKLGVFMHDFRIRTENVKVRTTKQLKASNIIKDTFYWPDMTVSFENERLFITRAYIKYPKPIFCSAKTS